MGLGKDERREVKRKRWKEKEKEGGQSKNKVHGKNME
jgi:hypothetical protein